MASVTTAEAVVAVSGVETEVEEGTQGKVRIRVIRHDLSVVREDGDGRALHLVAPTGIHPASENASVVVADARSASIPHVVLDRAVQSNPVAAVVGAVTSDREALVWVCVQPPAVLERVGYTVRVRSTEPGQPELYPSVVHGWARWWCEQHTDIPPGYPRRALLPLPPERIDVTMATDTYRLRVAPADHWTMRDREDPTEAL
ncbi:hypothetical protein [Streptomyces misionensis]|nr:hypothetical protein [Streptomyces misionensis]